MHLKVTPTKAENVYFMFLKCLVLFESVKFLVIACNR